MTTYTRVLVLLFWLIPAFLFAAEESVQEDAAQDKQETQKEPAEQSSGCKKYIDITVSIDENFPDKDRLPALDAYEVPRRIDNGIQCAIASDLDLEAAKSLKLKVKITGFRLRSGTTAVMGAAFAGPDYIHTEVSVEREGQTISQFASSISSAKGGFIMPAPTQRINRLALALGRKIAKNIQKTLRP